MIQDKTGRTARADVSGGRIKLLRKPYALQLNYTHGSAGGGVRLSWSGPSLPKQVIPTRCLYPVTPGGYTVENIRYPGQWPQKPSSP